LVSVFGEANTAPSCHGVSSPTQPRNFAPSVSISGRAVETGSSAASTVSPFSAAAAFDNDRSGSTFTSASLNLYLSASRPSE
jgi:hypothetical protein